MLVSGTVSGPTAIDDYILFTVQDGVTGAPSCQGRFVLHGSTIWQLYLDDLDDGPGVKDDATCSMTVYARHASGVTFDSLSLPGAYKHDGLHGLAALLSRRPAAAAPPDPDVASILAAVRKTY
jgi:hypothetical protein